MLEPRQPLRALRTRMRPSAAGAILLPLAFACFGVALFAGGPAILLAAATLSLLFVAMLASWIHLRGLRVHVPAAQERPVGEGFALPIIVQSTARFLPACAVTLRADRSSGRAGILPYLPALDSAEVAVPHRLSTRGLQEKLRLRVASAFPFGLVRCELDFTIPVHFLALPRPSTHEDLRRLASLTRPGARAMSSTATGDEELWGAREWREGESLRRAHWGLSAKRKRIIVSEYRQDSDGPLEVVLVCVAAELKASNRERSFERAVSLTAAVCERALRSKREVSLRLLESPHSPGASLHGRSGLALAMRALALVEVTSGDPIAMASKEARLAIANGRPLVCILAGGRRTSQAELQTGPGIYWIDVDAQPDSVAGSKA